MARPAEIPGVVARVVREGARAWPAFIEAYSDFILACIGRVASEPDERMEAYVHVCARLHADGCRRLAQFRGHSDKGPCRFTTWLATVVINLSKEWLRLEKGRRRMFRPLTRLSLLDQLVFRYHHWEKYPAGQIGRALRYNHGMSVSASEIEQAFGRIRGALNPSTRWRLVAAHNRSRGSESLDELREGAPERSATISHPGPRADALAGRRQAVRYLRAALDGLDDMERRVVLLRFAAGKTAREAAAELKLGNYKRVYEIQARALVKLRKALESRGVQLADFDRGLDAMELLR